MRIALIRHGETDWNRTGRMQGRLDIPLNEAGERQALLCGQALSGHPWGAVVTSPLSRARRTAELIAGCAGLRSVETDEGFAERDYGEGAGLTEAERERRYPLGCPGLESREAAGKRLAESLLRQAARFLGAGQDWIAVSHGSVIRAALPLLTGAALPETVVGNVAVTLLLYGAGEFSLEAYNAGPCEAARLLGEPPKSPCPGP